MIIKLIQGDMTMTSPIARTIASKGTEVARNDKAQRKETGTK